MQNWLNAGLFTKIQKLQKFHTMQFSDLISSMQLSAMLNVAQSQTDAEKYAQSVPTKIHERLYKLASELNCVLNADFWKDLQTEYVSDQSVMVCIKGNKATVMSVVNKPAFARHLGEMLKGGYDISWVTDTFYVKVSWDNWKWIYKALTETYDDSDLPAPISKRERVRIRVESDRQRMFTSAAGCNRYKKIGKRGFNTTFDEMRAQIRTEAYERKLRGVIGEAKRIIESL